MLGRIFAYNVNETWGWGKGDERTDEWDGPQFQGENSGNLEPVLFCFEFPDKMEKFENGEETPTEETWRKVMRKEAVKGKKEDFGRLMLTVIVMRWIDHSIGEWVLELNRRKCLGSRQK